MHLTWLSEWCGNSPNLKEISISGQSSVHLNHQGFLNAHTVVFQLVQRMQVHGILKNSIEI